MKQSDGLFSFKRMRSYKRRKEDSSSSSSSSSLGAAANIVAEPEPPEGNAGKIKDTFLTMGHAMENALLGDQKEDKKKHRRKQKEHENENKKKSVNENPPEWHQPTMNHLDFLQRRKLAAAQMRIRRESEMEKEHPMRHNLLDLHYLPPVLQDATTLNLTRFQVSP